MSINFSNSSDLMNCELYGVKIDDSEELQSLKAKAKTYKELPFDEKLEAIKHLTLSSMRNAWEGSKTAESPLKEKYKSMVFSQHPLSDALKDKMGCCRYQAILFFILASEAHLGEQHFIQSTPIDARISTCFNDIIHEGRTYHVSIFSDSLENKQLNYTQDNQVYEKATRYDPLRFFLSYKTYEGQITYQIQQGSHAGINPVLLQFQDQIKELISRGYNKDILAKLIGSHPGLTQSEKMQCLDIIAH